MRASQLATLLTVPVVLWSCGWGATTLPKSGTSAQRAFTAGALPGLEEIQDRWILLEAPMSGSVLGQGYNVDGGLQTACYIAQNRLDTAETRKFYRWKRSGKDSLVLAVANIFGIEFKGGAATEGQITIDTLLTETAVDLAIKSDCRAMTEGLPTLPVVVQSRGFTGYEYSVAGVSGANETKGFLKVHGKGQIAGLDLRVSDDSSAVLAKGKRWFAIRARGYEFGDPTGQPELSCGHPYNRDRSLASDLGLRVQAPDRDSLAIDHWSGLAKPDRPYRLRTEFESWFLIGGENVPANGGPVYRAQIYKDKTPDTSFCVRLQQFNTVVHDFTSQKDTAAMRAFIKRKAALRKVGVGVGDMHP